MVKALRKERESLREENARLRAEAVEMADETAALKVKLARVVEAIINEECDPPAAATTVQEQGFWSAGVATLRSKLLAAAKGDK